MSMACGYFARLISLHKRVLMALRSSRDYKRFYGEVYRYAFSLFLELDNQTHEQFAARLWKYCADVQCAYKEQLLRQKDIAEADKELLRTLTTRLGRHAHESREGIRRAYTLLVKVDGCKCEFAEMLQKKDRKGAIEFPVGVLHRMDEYITHLNETFARYLNLEKKIGAYIEHVKSIEESDRPPEERLPPFPTNIVASMYPTRLRMYFIMVISP